jgi:hypothetical protein
MPNLLVLGIYLLLLSSNGNGKGGIVFSMAALLKIRTTTTVSATSLAWWHRVSDDDIKVEMMSPSWNNFLRSFLRFVMVRSSHDEGLGRIIFRPVFLILRWQKEEGRHKKEKVSQLRLQECWPSFIGLLFSGLLLSVCLYVHPYETSHRFGFEIWSYSQCGYNLDENRFLNISSVF